MPTSSVIFSPEMNERQLDQEVDKIGESLDDADTTISPEIEGGGLDGLGGDGMGLDGDGGGLPGRGGGGGATTGALAGLTSKIPKPVAGVSVAAALPVALGGSIGLGILNAMHSASARLQTSTNILGSVWNDVWAPIGNKVDQLFVRDAVLDLKEESAAFRREMSQDDFITATVELGELGIDVLKWRRFIDPLLWPTHITELAWDTFVAPFDPAEKVANFNWNSVINRLSWGLYLNPLTWPAFIPKLAWDTFVGDVNLSNWVEPVNLGSFVEGVDLSEFVDGIDFGGGDGGGGGRGGGGEGGGGPIVPPWIPGDGPILERGSPNPTPNNTANVMNLEQAVTNADTSGDTSAIEAKLDQLNRNINRLARELAGMNIQVDGEQFGRLTTETRTDQVFDTDATI